MLPGFSIENENVWCGALSDTVSSRQPDSKLLRFNSLVILYVAVNMLQPH